MNPNPRIRGIKEKDHIAIKHNPYRREKAKGNISLRNAREGTIHIIDHRYRHGMLWLPKGHQTGNTQPQVEPNQHTRHTKPAKQIMHA